MANNTEKLKSLLQGLTSVKTLKEILNYIGFNIISQETQIKIDGLEQCHDIQAFPIAKHGEYLIIYIKINSEKLSLSDERVIIKKLQKQYPHSFFVFSNELDELWHFVNAKTIDISERETEISARKKRLDSRHIAQRITIGPEEREYNRLRTAAERLAMVSIPETGLPPLEVQRLLDSAFDVETVTEEFYKQYHDLFESLIADFKTQTKDDSKWAHDFTLQMLNRIMLLHFVQKKGWLGDDPDFLNTFWKTYNKSFQPKNSFYSGWLEVLFFTAFNNSWQNRSDRLNLPEDIRNILATAPYLNGGLFTENDLDKKHKGDFIIRDERWCDVFNFFNSYNFTITEDTPLDQEVAVDPEMIGHVYESLVNLSEYEERRKAGIFYTPQTEIELMCRLSLSDYLVNHLGDEHRNLILEFVFAIDDEEKNAADRQIQDADLARRVDDLLKKVTVLDPACGSGSFLVGMLNVLYNLSRRVGRKILGEEETDYERKRRIIRESLYGVDIMKWAVDIAELRLWLQLLIDTDIPEVERHLRPLLPNLDFKLRIGDSLVQEVGGYNLSHYRRKLSDLPPDIKGRITRLKGEKRKFYNAEMEDKSAKTDHLKNDEAALFRMILDNRIFALERNIKENEKQIETEDEHMYKNQGKFANVEMRDKLSREIEESVQALGQLKIARKSLFDVKIIPFVWDIAFIEIFEDDKNGFDIVIGNPPYVRQEKIAAPEMPDGSRITSDKKEYKAKLMKAVYSAYPDYFDYIPDKEKKLRKKLDAKSDLYIYFYFLSLSLLNPKGSFCFITSISWLDVGYGCDLQEFLIKTTPIKLIIDNKVERSFKQADINTVIALLGRPYDKQLKDFDDYARFVMFEIPFEGAFSSVIFEEIFEATEKKRTAEYQIFPKTFAELLMEGVELKDEEKEEKEDGLNLKYSPSASIGPLIKTARYIGNKWGGKYLRAPDIYWTILEKGKGKLVRLGDVAKVRFGIKTGANKFFYLKSLGPADKNGLVPVRNGAGWEGEIEEEFLKQVIKSPRECNSILIKPDDLKYKIFMCHKDKTDLKGSKALKYIQWGEDKSNYNPNELSFNERPSCKGRKNWYDVGSREIPPIICPGNIYEYLRAFYNLNVFADKRLYEIYPNGDYIKELSIILNLVITSLFIDLGSRSGLGEGLIDLTVCELANCQIIDPLLIIDEHLHLFERNKNRLLLKYGNEINNEDRLEMEKSILSILKLDEDEIEELHSTFGMMIKNRLQKAENY